MTKRKVVDSFIEQNYKLWKDKDIPFISTVCKNNEEISKNIEIIKENIYKSVANEIYDSLESFIYKHVEATIQSYKDSCDNQLKIAKDNIVTDEKLKEKIVDLTNEIHTLRDGLHCSESNYNKLKSQEEEKDNDSKFLLKYLTESEDSDKIKVMKLVAHLGSVHKYKIDFIPHCDNEDEEDWN